MVTGIQEVSGDYYYFNNAGEMQVGWLQVNGEWYYFKVSGEMLRNATTPDGYKVDSDGRWLQNRETTSTGTTTVKIEESTSTEPTLREQVEHTTESTTSSEEKSVPASSDKVSD